MKNPTKLLMKNFSRVEPHTVGFVLLAGCFLISMALLLISASSVVSFPSLSFWLSSHAASSGPRTDERIIPLKQDPMEPNERLQGRPLCDTSDRVSDICDMEGDVRVQGSSSSIFFVMSSNWDKTRLQESWQIKPHPRKGDIAGMWRVTEVSVKHVCDSDAPKCDINLSVPAIIFSTGGYMGNFFHDFNDVMISLFMTAYQFKGEVQFLMREMRPSWNAKYAEILKQLSHYEIIDFNQDTFVRCYPHVIVGIKSHGHKVLGIDPEISSELTMVDFGQFIKRAYALQRETAIRLVGNQNKKPRLLLIARNVTRKFTNTFEIARTAEWLGFEVVEAEMQANSSLAEFAQIVNSCDVLMGVHGAGLTNLLFLPTNAIVIQVCPIGGLELICWSHFGQVTLELNMRYLQYSISVTESTLIEEYHLDNLSSPVLTEPKVILNQKDGWREWTKIYFFKQNVKLDMRRFNSVLLQTLELLRH